MTTINDLSVASSVSSDDKLPIWQNANGVTRGLPVSVLDGRYLTQDAVALLAASAKVEMFISSILPNPTGLPTFVAGVTTSLTLANQYYSAENIEPFFDAAFQGPDQYSLIGYGLNFNSPIPLGVQMVYVRGGAARVIGAPSDGTVTDASMASGSWVGNLLGNTVVVTRSTIAQLRAIDHTKITAAFVTGYYASLDGGGGAYIYDPTDTSSADNGGSIIVATDGARWKLVGAPDWYVEQFGAIGNGATDDSAAINAAIAALPNRGGTVRFKGKSYAIGSPLIGGNGNAGSIASTKNGIRLIGEGGGFGIASPPSTQIFALNSFSTTAWMLSFQGAMSDVTLESISFYCNLKAKGGVFFESVCGILIRRVSIAQYTYNGLFIMGGTAPTGNYNIVNEFHQVVCASTANNHFGLIMDGNWGVSNDTWLTQFFTCRFDTTSSTGSIAGLFKFVDSCSFHRCHFTGDNTGGVGMSGCYGCYFDSTTNNLYPGGLAFYDCSILTTFVNSSAGNSIGINYFIGFGVFDNEHIPTDSHLIGITAAGHPFNGWGT